MKSNSRICTLSDQKLTRFSTISFKYTIMGLHHVKACTISGKICLKHMTGGWALGVFGSVDAKLKASNFRDSRADSGALPNIRI